LRPEVFKGEKASVPEGSKAVAPFFLTPAALFPEISLPLKFSACCIYQFELGIVQFWQNLRKSPFKTAVTLY